LLTLSHEEAKKAIMVSLLLFGVVFVVLNVLAYKQAYAMMHFTTQGARTREPERLPGMAKSRFSSQGQHPPATSAVLPRLSIRLPPFVHHDPMASDWPMLVL
jgi:Na+-transporting methylmalonyl-CoA/oxaloacetate decarboxylase gamma subunit